MQIVFYNHTGTVSGAERMLLLSLSRLTGDLYQTSLVCPIEGTLMASARALGIPCHEAAPILARFTWNPIQLLRYIASIGRALLGLRHLFQSLNPDIIQANTVRAGIVATLATTGTRTPVIWHNHDILPVHPITFFVRWLAHSTRRNYLVACSQAAATSLKGRGWNSNSDVTVILNGIELEKYRKSEDTRRLMRAQLGCKEGALVVGIVGQITRRKNQLGVIRAFARLQALFPDAVLMIAGAPLFNKDDDYLALLQGEVRNAGLQDSVLFLGHRSDAPDVMQALDIVVLNSDIEPFALVLVEAMMMEKATIATASGGPTELITPGVNGDIVPVGDSDALADAMIALAERPGLRQEYGIRARRHVQAELTAEKYIRRWQDLYSIISSADMPLARRPHRANQSVIR